MIRSSKKFGLLQVSKISILVKAIVILFDDDDYDDNEFVHL